MTLNELQLPELGLPSRRPSGVEIKRAQKRDKVFRGVTEMSVVVAMGITGGLGTLVGPVISAAALLYLSDQLRVVGEGYSSLLFGIALVFVVVVVPWGVRSLRSPRG